MTCKLMKLKILILNMGFFLSTLIQSLLLVTCFVARSSLAGCVLGNVSACQALEDDLARDFSCSGEAECHVLMTAYLEAVAPTDLADVETRLLKEMANVAVTVCRAGKTCVSFDEAFFVEKSIGSAAFSCQHS
jgi:hypothetical protein